MKPKPMRTFSIIPALPERLKPLWDLAYNLRWAWKHDIIELFLRLDSDLWEKTGHNPVLMLGTIDQERLEAVANDVGFLAHLDRVTQYLKDHLDEKKTAWFARAYGETRDPLIAYFSFEFGITECLTIFAGGLGILSGDHIKSASDLGIPLVGVGLLYQQGYFRQYLNQAGWQQEAYEDNHFDNLPLHVVQGLRTATPLTISVELPRPDGLRARVAGRRGTRGALSARYQHPAEHAPGGPRHHGPVVRWRSGPPHPSGNPVGYRRLSRAASAGRGADRLPYERGPRGVPELGAYPPSDDDAQPHLQRGAGSGVRRIWSLPRTRP